MHEIEVRSVVTELAAARRRVEAAGGMLRFAGRLEDRHWDTSDGVLSARGEKLRLRVYGDGGEGRASLDWKGPSASRNGYKVGEELSISIKEPAAAAALLAALGYVVIRELDREVVVYEIAGATVRFECYPRMDALVEVEGEPETIERAIGATGLPRAGFTPERSSAFVARYEKRSGHRAMLCDRDLPDRPSESP